MQQNFIFGGNTGRTYDDLQKQREIALKLIANSKTPRNVGEGLDAIGKALLARSMRKKADTEEERQRDEFADQWASVLGGFGSGGGGYLAGATGEYTADPGQSVADDAMRAIGKNPVGGGMDSYADAIAAIESQGSGDYSAVGPTHPKMGRALGRYQVMESNIGPWSKEALGREVSADEFLQSPEIQDAVFRHKFGGYVEKYGPEGAAQAWFGGPGGVGKLNRKDSLGTSIGDYTQKFRNNLGAAPQQQQPQPPGMQQVAQLLQLSQSPYASEGQRAVAQMLLGQYQQQQATQAKRSDPAYQLDMQMKQAQLDQMRNQRPEAPKVVEINGQSAVFNPQSGQYEPVQGFGTGTQIDAEGESKLRKEFAGLAPVKAFQEQAQAFGRIVASAKDPSPAGDLAMVFNYMKVLDPGSVVRESEFATAESAASWLQNSEEAGMTVPLPVARAVRRMATGQRLSPEQRQDFLGRAGMIYQQSESQHEQLARQYGITAQDYGFERDRTIPDFRYRPEGAPPMATQRPQVRPGSGEAVVQPAPEPQASEPEAPEPKKQGWTSQSRETRDKFIESRFNELLRDENFIEKYKALSPQEKAKFWDRQWQQHGVTQ